MYYLISSATVDVVRRWAARDPRGETVRDCLSYAIKWVADNRGHLLSLRDINTVEKSVLAIWDDAHRSDAA